MMLFCNPEKENNINKTQENNSNKKPKNNTNNTNTNNYKKIGIGIGFPVGILTIYKIVKYISDSNKKAQKRNLEVSRNIIISQKIIETYGKDVTIDGLYSAINEFLLSLNGTEVSFYETCPPTLRSIKFKDSDNLTASFKKLYIIGILYAYYDSTLQIFNILSSDDCTKIEDITNGNINIKDNLSEKSNKLVGFLWSFIRDTIVNKNCGRPCVNLNYPCLQDLVKILFHNSEISEDLLKKYPDSNNRPEFLKFTLKLIDMLNSIEIINDHIVFS